MADHDDALIEKAAKAVMDSLLAARIINPKTHTMWTDWRPEAIAVLDAVADDLRREGAGAGPALFDRAMDDVLARAEQAEADLRRAHAALTHENQLRVDAEAALSRLLADMEELGALVDGITDTDGGKWIPCADVLTLVAEHRDRA